MGIEIKTTAEERENAIRYLEETQEYLIAQGKMIEKRSRALILISFLIGLLVGRLLWG